MVFFSFCFLRILSNHVCICTKCVYLSDIPIKLEEKLLREMTHFYLVTRS